MPISGEWVTIRVGAVTCDTGKNISRNITVSAKNNSDPGLVFNSNTVAGNTETVNSIFDAVLELKGLLGTLLFVYYDPSNHKIIGVQTNKRLV